MSGENLRFAAPIGRWFIGILFILSVGKKIAAPAATIVMLGELGLPGASAFYALAVLGELGGTLMLVLGWKTRIGAVVLVAFTVVATLLVHMHPSDPAQMTHVFKNLAIIGGLLQVLVLGGGAWALDNRSAKIG